MIGERRLQGQGESSPGGIVLRRDGPNLQALPRPGIRLISWVLLGLALIGVPAAAQTNPGSPGTLVLEDIVLEGTDRTPLATVLLYLPLRPGQTLDQETLVAGVAELKVSGLFADLDYYTRPGSERGHLVLVLEVREKGLDFRLATGNTDLDGWYIVPAMVALDNTFGRGGRLDLSWRIGFRTNGLLLTYVRPRAGREGRDYWGGRLYAQNTDRPYFYQGIEYRHEVIQSGLEMVYGRRWGGGWIGETGLTLEAVDAASEATALVTLPDGTREDVTVGYEDLPPGVQSGVGRDGRAILHLDFRLDNRASRLRAGTPVSGFWGRLKPRVVLQDERSHASLLGDLRGYREVPGGVLAGRLRGSVVGENAAFYDRLYLGGMYTVRGCPTNSLSAAGGDTWLWSGSLEYRSRILGKGDDTRLAGLFFLDGGAAGGFDHDAIPGVSLGAGYGLRVKIIWLDWLGLDVGFPLTTRPVDARFHVNASLGWSF